MLRYTAIGLESLPEIRQGADLAEEILRASEREGHAWRSESLIVIAQKAVSKAEGSSVDLTTVRPSQRACAFAKEFGKDPRLVELALREAKRVVRMERGVLITETRQGWICANSGVDCSNVPGGDTALLLPEDSDRSARDIREELERRLGLRLAVIVCDSFGRPWRQGQVESAIGVSGVAPLLDLRGSVDRQGHTLRATVQAVADEAAGAAGLLMRKSSGVPVVILEGLDVPWDPSAASGTIRRPSEEDLFR